LVVVDVVVVVVTILDLLSNWIWTDFGSSMPPLWSMLSEYETKSWFIFVQEYFKGNINIFTFLLIFSAHEFCNPVMQLRDLLGTLLLHIQISELQVQHFLCHAR
jgi:hypothetical protein